MRKYSTGLLLVFLLAMMQTKAAEKSGHLTLNDYLQQVLRCNLGLISEKLNVDAADARVVASRIFADPELSLTYTDNQDKKMKMGRSLDAGLSIPVRPGNPRGASIAQAKTQAELSRLALSEYLQNLRSDAVVAFLNAQYQKQMFDIESDTYLKLTALAASDSIRLAKGAINQVSAMQSAIQAKAQYNTVLQARSDYQNSLTDLSTLLGQAAAQNQLQSVDSLQGFGNRFFSPDTLLSNGVTNRIAFQLAVKNRELSEKTLRLIRANRAPEFSLDAGYSRSAEVRNSIAPAPAFHSLSAGMTIPLKFSALNKGEIHAAKLELRQSEIMVEQTRLQIEAEIHKSYINYQTTNEQMNVFSRGILKEAERIYDKQVYAYQRGETGILEVLTAQQNLNELRKQHAAVVLNQSIALVQLEKSAGIWDIN